MAQGLSSVRDDTYIPLSPPARHNLSYVESKDEVERNHGGILVTVGADLLYKTVTTNNICKTPELCLTSNISLWSELSR